MKYSSEGGTVRLTTELIKIKHCGRSDEAVTLISNEYDGGDIFLGNEANSPLSTASTSRTNSPMNVPSGTTGPLASQAIGQAAEPTATSSTSHSYGNSIAARKERARQALLRANLEEGVCLMIRITVEDTGIGIPEDMKNNLFQPFAQVFFCGYV